MDPRTQQFLSARLQYYRDLGIYDFYRREVTATQTQAPPEPALSEVEGRDECSPARPGSPARSHLARWGGYVPGQR